MEQNVENKSSVGSQLIVGSLHGDVNPARKTRFSKRFERLNKEVENNEKYNDILSDLEYYNTKLDGKDMPSKLEDGGFSQLEILKATKKKEKYAKKAEKYKFFESAQWIDSQLFAKIKLEYENFVEPLINSSHSKGEVMSIVVEKVVKPVLELINIEGESDELLNYDAEDILGMIYYLTGKCHINWKNYDSI